jgi:hypothetical protein
MQSFGGTSQSVCDRSQGFPCSFLTRILISENASTLQVYKVQLYFNIVLGATEHARIPLGGRQGECQLEEVHGPRVFEHQGAYKDSQLQSSHGCLHPRRRTRGQSHPTAWLGSLTAGDLIPKHQSPPTAGVIIQDYVACKVMLILQHVVCLKSFALRLRKHFRRRQTIGIL